MKIGVLSNMFEEYTHKEVEDDLVEVAERVQAALKELGHEVEFFDVNEKTFEKLRRSNVDFAFNVCERFKGNSVYEPHIAAMLELLNIPYTGSGPWALALCMNKIRVKEILMQNDIPTPAYQVFHSRNKKLNPELKFPLILKPALMDNSIGITQDSVVYDEPALRSRVGHLLKTYGQPVLAEEYIDGRDLDVGVLGNGSEAMCLPIAEISYDKFPKGKPKIFSYESKWEKDSEFYSTEYVFPAQLPKYLEARVKKVALEAYRLLETRDYGRVDIRLSSEGIPYVLEMNPNPGISAECSTPLAAQSLGISYTEMINQILQCALKRYGMLASQQPIIQDASVKKSVVAEA